ncbi:MAG TPA: tyrosine-type recombinase/integrase [Gemmataceae bacterium]|jgi:integrase|nr:tyrosine-type recombinase/integrase [Gemmataceae bacterium]
MILDSQTALTRFETNKGKRAFETPLHPALIDQLTPVCSDRVSGSIFFWNRRQRQLDSEFHRLRAKAGIRLKCARSHLHTDACHCYGFHHLRRAFATINAGSLQGDVLQKLMRHQSLSTTQRYIKLSKRLDESVGVLDVPEFLRGGR